MSYSPARVGRSGSPAKPKSANRTTHFIIVSATDDMQSTAEATPQSTAQSTVRRPALRIAVELGMQRVCEGQTALGRRLDVEPASLVQCRCVGCIRVDDASVGVNGGGLTQGPRYAQLRQRVLEEDAVGRGRQEEGLNRCKALAALKFRGDFELAACRVDGRVELADGADLGGRFAGVARAKDEAVALGRI